MITTEFVALALAVAFIVSIIFIVIYNVSTVKSSSKIQDNLDDGDCKEVVDYDDLKIINKWYSKKYKRDPILFWMLSFSLKTILIITKNYYYSITFSLFKPQFFNDVLNYRKITCPIPYFSTF